MNTENQQFPIYFKDNHGTFTRFTSPTQGIEVGLHTAKPTVLSLAYYDANCQSSNKSEWIAAVNDTERKIREVLEQAIKTIRVESFNKKIAFEELRLRAGEPELDKLQEMQDEEERINNHFEDNLFEETN